MKTYIQLLTSVKYDKSYLFLILILKLKNIYEVSLQINFLSHGKFNKPTKKYQPPTHFLCIFYFCRIFHYRSIAFGFTDFHQQKFRLQSFNCRDGN